MRYCENCRAARDWPQAQPMTMGFCELCGTGPGSMHDVTAMALPMPDPNFTTTQQQVINSVDNPFSEAPVDPRALELQEQRDAMAAGKAAAVSLAPNYEALKLLTQWLAENGWDAMQIADAVKRPQDYWPYYAAAHEGGDLASGNQG